jgi:hypothetical protein
MKTKLLVSIIALCACGVLAQETFSLKPAVVPEQWTLSLGGSGATTTTGDSQTIFGTDLSLGRTGHLLLPLEGGLRQSFGYDSRDDGSVLFSTRLYLDATLLSYKKLDLFAGGSFGLTYGNTKPLWEAGPEAGLRFWLKKDVALLGRVEYPFDLDNGRSNDFLRYFLGIQAKF